jgi:hypothetical protein
VLLITAVCAAEVAADVYVGTRSDLEDALDEG